MKKLYLMIILLVALSGSLFGENPYEKYSSDFVRINVQSLEKQLFMEYNNREFKTMTMAKAAFIASGVTSKPELDAYMTRFDAVIKGIKKNYPNLSSLPQRRQGEIILKYIHKHVFKKYLFWSTTFKHIFDKGEFNCLISAVFFNAVCEEFNLKTRGTTNYNHAVSMFYAGNVV
ncbi:MAG: hypothetical protein OEZ36_09870, partial [Spirochaetota bacterium]|nr:hypothetical protein [Spirochaetota bacterium]